jgi:hypothetical protein
MGIVSLPLPSSVAFQRVLGWSDLYAGVAVLRENRALGCDGLPVPLPKIGRNPGSSSSRVLLRRTFGCWHGQCDCMASAVAASNGIGRSSLWRGVLSGTRSIHGALLWELSAGGRRTPRACLKGSAQLSRAFWWDARNPSVFLVIALWGVKDFRGVAQEGSRAGEALA